MSEFIFKLIADKKDKKDQPESTVYDTSFLTNVIGQTSAIKKLDFFISSSNEDIPFPTLLFTGSQGLGKTHVANKVAESLNRKLIEINCSTIKEVSDLIDSLIENGIIGDEMVTVLFDESHHLNDNITTWLLTLLNPQKDPYRYFTHNDIKFSYDTRKINVIFCTTDAHLMFKPLLNRCTEIYFDRYSNEDIFDIIRFYAKDIVFKCNETNLAMACRGRARDAYLMANNVIRYCNIRGSIVFDNIGLKEIEEIFEIYPMGLKKKEFELVKLLSKYDKMSCSNIASMFGVNVDNVSSEIEIRPIELGLIQIVSRGRTLTEDGINYYKTYCEVNHD